MEGGHLLSKEVGWLFLLL